MPVAPGPAVDVCLKKPSIYVRAAASREGYDIEIRAWCDAVTSPKKQTVLLTLGRLPVALDLARSFHRAGWRVIVAEPFNMHLCRMSRAVHRNVRVTAPAENAGRYVDELCALIGEESVDLVVPVSEETAHVAALAERPQIDATVFSAKACDVLELHDKLSFNRRAMALDLPVPKTWTLADDAGRPPDGIPVVVKPRFSCSGRGVRYEVADSALQAAPDCIVQEQLEGPHLSTFAIARAGCLLANVVYQPRVVSGSVSVCFERVEDEADVEDWVRCFVERSGHTGFIGFDFIRDAEGVPRAIECNPRATSGIHFLKTDTLAGLVTPSASVALTDTQLYRRTGRLVESYSCFTELLGALPDWRMAKRIFRELRQAKDISWSRSDPWPFLLMTVNTWPIIRRALAARRTFAEVAVADLEWRYRHA